MKTLFVQLLTNNSHRADWKAILINNFLFILVSSVVCSLGLIVFWTLNWTCFWMDWNVYSFFSSRSLYFVDVVARRIRFFFQFTSYGVCVCWCVCMCFIYSYFTWNGNAVPSRLCFELDYIMSMRLMKWNNRATIHVQFLHSSDCSVSFTKNGYLIELALSVLLVVLHRWTFRECSIFFSFNINNRHQDVDNRKF